MYARRLEKREVNEKKGAARYITKLNLNNLHKQYTLKVCIMKDEK